MDSLVSYGGIRVAVIDEETGEETGEFVTPDGSPIIEGVVSLSIEQITELDAVRTITLDQKKAAKIEAVRVLTELKFDTGAPIESGGEMLHVSVSDGSRADIGSMATNATATIMTNGLVPWLDAYVLGWISIENVRIPLHTPQDGLAFASAVAAFYADARQRGRTLKDACLAAEDEAALNAIDIESGWPA